MISLSGDIHEGGGQILRTALALSARTGQAFRLERIRAGRQKPGLQAQHLAAVSLAQQVCAAEVRFARRHSQELEFVPGPLRAGDFAVDIGTAGSVSLLLQAVLWAAAVAPGPSRFEIRGGTDVPWSPPLDYLLHVTLPYLDSIATVETEAVERGFNPRGGGRWVFRVHPVSIDIPLRLVDRPRQWVVRASLVMGEGREAMAAEIRRRFPDVAELRCEPVKGRDVSATLWAEGSGIRQGATLLADKGYVAGQGESLARQLMARLRRTEPVEEHLADQLIPLLALQGGEMLCQEITPHVLANMAVVEAFLGPRFTRDGLLLRAKEAG